ncbi:hypothetical protein [Alysiella filiformis]|uniref:Lipoprotein n=1 Tax=Alysiella filiformis DSM 16848 TaxID=1120981 RepID=A0A286E3A7_9NEIS|nr:hypothetical protein [Alysiella filiformis]QMT31111.1 hypothetical protein H3L97_10385 [Alysiella filiformis]UBQ55896.1 hypothetical protein JF568_10085 [Alysiella filiformis DSM 16848]SOD65387.1 hypothetical protein SAMN02746062_00273 [Alysiella filiformis DSM 16848]
MFDKTLSLMILVIGLSACTSTTSPSQQNNSTHTANDFTLVPHLEEMIQKDQTEPKFDDKAHLLHGKWHCDVPIREDLRYHFDVNYQKDGTLTRKGVIVRNLTHDLKYEFEHTHQAKWQIRKRFYQEKTMGEHQVTLLPETNPHKQMALAKLEKQEPDALSIKNEMAQDLKQYWGIFDAVPFTIKALDEKQFRLVIGGMHGMVLPIPCQKVS